MQISSETVLNEKFYKNYKSIYTTKDRFMQVASITTGVFFGLLYLAAGYLFAMNLLYIIGIVILAAGLVIFCRNTMKLHTYGTKQIETSRKEMKKKNLTREYVTILTNFYDDSLEYCSEINDGEKVYYKQIYDVKEKGGALVIYITEKKKLVCEGLEDKQRKEIITKIKTENKTEKCKTSKS